MLILFIRASLLLVKLSIIALEPETYEADIALRTKEINPL
jgi:hypothetical protein